MMKQNNYREWFWSHLPVEGSNSNLDLLDSPDPVSEAATNLTTYPNNIIEQLTAYLQEIEEIIAQARLEEQESELELIRGAASMFILQGDIKGAEVCQIIENLIKTTDLS